MNNVFAIPKADTIHCLVVDYHWGRGALTLKLTRLASPDVSYIRFHGVEVFAGPMQWDGANFVRQTTKACLEIMQLAGRAGEFVTEKDLDERHISLYSVQLEHMEVQIVANMANKYSG